MADCPFPRLITVGCLETWAVYKLYIYVISTSVLYIQASVFPGTCPYKVGSELCSNYVRFDVLIWRIIPHDDVICKI